MEEKELQKLHDGDEQGEVIPQEEFVPVYAVGACVLVGAALLASALLVYALVKIIRV